MGIKKISILFSILLLTFALVACGNDDGKKEEGSKGTTENAKFKDTLNIAITAQPPTLDSAMTVSSAALGIALNVYEQLYVMDANYKPTPMLAESVKQSEDGLTYTFKLREGVKFHNDKEMTSEDVVASMNRWLVTSSRAKALLEGAKFEVVDKYNVNLTVTQPTSDVMILISSKAQFAAIMPKEIVEAAPAEGVQEHIGTGPYKFEEWKQDQYIHLVKNEAYQAVDIEPSGYAGRKDAPTKNLYYHFVTDHSTRIAGIQTGKYDVADSIPVENYDQLDADKKVELSTFPGGSLTAFLNTSQGVLANEKYRQAILAALNNEDIMLASFAKPELYSLAPGYMNANQEQWASEAGAELYNQGNQEKAKKLLKEAGYNGEEITLVTTKDYAEMYAATIVIQEQLRQIGMKVKVENYDFPTFLETKNDPNKWDLFVASTGYQSTPPQLLAVTPDWAGLKNDEVKASLAAIRSAATPEDANKEWDKLQGFLYELGSSTVIGHYNEVVALTNKIEGYEQFETSVVWNAKVSE
ncbi:MAG: ABC transporter substrate-binding protein [Lysinibacillus sp.]